MLVIYLTGFLLLLIFAYLIFQIFGLIALFQMEKPVHKKPEKPFISILVAARNEEKNIQQCLASLAKINYPPGLIEILIGNDCSEDLTGNIVEEFTKQHAQFKVFHLDGSEYNSTKGKARVLAFLANQAKGEYLFVTDADIEVNPEWVRELLNHFEEITGLVTGMTIIRGKGFFASMQSLDWLYFLSLINVYSRRGVHITAVGNNMAIRKKAYWDTGGYESIPFSITEDYKLFRAVRNAGWETKNILTPESIVFSKPVLILSDYLFQRKRWLKGALEMPFFYKLMLLIIMCFYPAVFLLLFIYPKFFVYTWFLKYTFQTIHIVQASNVLNRPPVKIFKLILFEIYQFLSFPLMALFNLIPVKTIWKGRKL